MPSASRAANELHERIDIAPDHAVTCFHPLDGRQRKPGRFGELPLVYSKKGAAGAQLPGCDHSSPIKAHEQNRYFRV